MTETCTRCETGPVTHIVRSDMIHMRVCRECAERAHEIMAELPCPGQILSIEEIKTSGDSNNDKAPAQLRDQRNSS